MGVPQLGGGTPTRGTLTWEGYPQSDLDREYPNRGYPGSPIRPGWGYPNRGYPDRGVPQVPPSQTWMGDPDQGVPPSQYPPGGTLMGVSQWQGGNPGTLTGRGVPQIPSSQTWMGGTLTGGYPDRGYPNREGVPWVPPLSDLDRGVPQRGGFTPLRLTDRVLDKRRSV